MKARLIFLILLCFNGFLGQPVTEHLPHNDKDRKIENNQHFSSQHKQLPSLKISQQQFSSRHGVVIDEGSFGAQEGPPRLQDLPPFLSNIPDRPSFPSNIQNIPSFPSNKQNIPSFPSNIPDRPSIPSRIPEVSSNPDNGHSNSQEKPWTRHNQLSVKHNLHTNSRQKYNNKNPVNHDKGRAEKETVTLTPELLKLLYQTINETVEQMKMERMGKQTKKENEEDNIKDDNPFETLHSTTQTHSQERIEVSSSIPQVKIFKTKEPVTEAELSTNKLKRIIKINRKSNKLPARSTTTPFSIIKTSGRDNSAETITKSPKLIKTQQPVKLRINSNNRRKTLDQTLSTRTKQTAKTQTKNLTTNLNGPSLNKAQNLPKLTTIPSFLFKTKTTISKTTTSMIEPHTTTSTTTISTIPIFPTTDSPVRSSHILKDDIPARATEITVELTSSHQSDPNNLNISSRTPNHPATQLSQTGHAPGHVYYTNVVETQQNEDTFKQEEVLPQPLPCLGGSNTLEEGDIEESEVPLISISEINPSGMMLLIKPNTCLPNTQVKITYSKVGSSDPMVEYMSLDASIQSHGLYNLEEGLYLVCGETWREHRILQTSCIQTHVDNRKPYYVLPAGVIAVIALASIIIVGVFIYSIYFSSVITTRKKKQRELQEKVDKFAKKEREIREKELAASHFYATLYPDPNEPYEERCIM